MTRALIVGWLAVAALLSGCGPKLIPGTEIKDTDENREVLAVIDRYRVGLQDRNPQQILALVSRSFFETSGTPEGNDDYDYVGLQTKLEAWAKEVKAARVDFDVKRIVITEGQATAQYFYDVNYQVPAPSNDALLWKRESDTNILVFKREEGTWRIVSGL